MDESIAACDGCKYVGGYNGTYCMNGLISEAAVAWHGEEYLLSNMERSITAIPKEAVTHWMPLPPDHIDDTNKMAKLPKKET